MAGHEPMPTLVSTNHKGIPGQVMEELSEQVVDPQLFHNPVVTVTVDDRLVEIENDDQPRH